MATPTMAAAANDMTQLQRVVCALAFFLLFLGIGRLASLVLHEPLLGYANSYDMIRLQACHQIWPADKGVDITDGTPQAPLRRYTLDKQLDTPCFPSSELLFTGSGIALAQLKNLVTGETLVSLKMIGLTKAIFLCVTALLASLYFFRQRMQQAMLVNGLLMAGVLSDPGITLYLNTFYTEFSAVYFLYLALIGLVVAGTAPRRWFYGLPLLAGLVGLGLSKPQHLPLALLLGTLAGMWLWRQPWRPLAVLAVLCGALPLLLQASGHWVPRSDNMALANRVNLLGALLADSPDPQALLKSLGLPADCGELAGKNWYHPVVQSRQPCQALAARSHSKLLLLTASQQPATLLAMAKTAIPMVQQWLFPLYGQVEGKTNGRAAEYQRSLGQAVERMPAVLFTLLWLLPLPLYLLALALARKTQQQGHAAFCVLLALIQWSAFAVALYGDGLVDLAKHAHIATTVFLSLLIFPGMVPRGKRPAH